MAKTNKILILAVIVLGLLFLRQCNRSSNMADKLYIERNNQAALVDSLNTYKTKTGKLVYEKGSLIASKKQLKKLNSNLYSELKQLKDNPKVIIKNEFTVIHDTIRVNTEITKTSDISTKLTWQYDTTYSSGNFQKLSGETHIILDSCDVINASTSINDNQFGISLIAGLKEEEDRYKIFVKSDFPGFSVSNIEGAIIDKKMIQSNESAWVIGPQLGYGLQFAKTGDITHGWQFGIGMTYNINKRIKKLFR